MKDLIAIFIYIFVVIVGCIIYNRIMMKKYINKHKKK